jgi:hypothetical protein
MSIFTGNVIYTTTKISRNRARPVKLVVFIAEAE